MNSFTITEYGLVLLRGPVSKLVDCYSVSVAWLSVFLLDLSNVTLKDLLSPHQLLLGLV